LPQQVRDRYFRETACVAEALGARDVPRSAADVDAFFAAQQSRLHFSSRSREVLRVLAGIDLQLPGNAGLRELFLGAGAALLPDWASDAMQRTRLRRQRDRLAARALKAAAPMLRAALSNGIAARSCRRMGVSPEILGDFGDA
ncbi:MAG TPA: oxygenase MpaB family protein, partial [Solimonas sp.]